MSLQGWRQGQRYQVVKKGRFRQIACRIYIGCIIEPCDLTAMPGQILLRAEAHLLSNYSSSAGEGPICSSRCTGHARLARMTGGDKEWGVCIDADAPSGKRRVQLNSLIKAFSLSVSQLMLSILTIVESADKSME